MVPFSKKLILLLAKTQLLNSKLKGRILMIFKIVSTFNELFWKAFPDDFYGNVVVGGWVAEEERGVLEQC